MIVVAAAAVIAVILLVAVVVWACCFASARGDARPLPENVTSLRGRRLHVIEGGLGEVGRAADAVWPTPVSSRHAAREMASSDGLGGAA